MPKVIFEASSVGPSVTSDEPEGGKLVDICDDTDAPVPFSCRGASCGTCRVDVLEGASLFEPADPDELDVLDMFADPPNRRLACSARIKAGPGTIRLRVVED